MSVKPKDDEYDYLFKGTYLHVLINICVLYPSCGP